MRYRIALCGFSEFEHRAIHFSFQHPSEHRESEYDLVDALSDADFAIVDADSKPAVRGVLQSGRVGQAVFVGNDAPEGAASHLPRPIDPTRILRLLDELTARHEARMPHDLPEATMAPDELLAPLKPMPPAPPAASSPARPASQLPPLAALRHDLPTLDDIVVTPLAPKPVPATPRTPTEAKFQASAQANAKAAARAKARRARLANDLSTAQPAVALHDVLVLEADRADNDALCALLANFGFRPHPVVSVAEAAAALDVRPFAAVFLDLALDDAGVALLQQIRALPVPAGHGGPAVLMVAGRLDPSDRVRAALAGLTEPLLKPVARGDVARALEGAGVALPADARRR